MKRIFGILILVISISACTESGQSAVPTASSLGEGYVSTTYDGIPGLERATKSTGDGTVLEEGDVLNGKLHGNWLTYHQKNGLVATITGYRNGLKHGSFVKINDKGYLDEKAYYVNNLMEGKRIVYNRTRIKEEADYKGGELHGERKRFYDDGKPQEEGQFTNGKRDGYARWYNQEGEITIEYQYDNGKKVE